MLTALNRSLQPAALARAIVDAYIADYRSRGEQNVTQSAIDVARTEAAVVALHDFGRVLLPRLATKRAVICAARLAAQVYEYADYVDAIDVATRLARALNEPAVTTAANRLITATRNAILLSRNFGQAVRASNGLSIWYPATQDVLLANRAKYLSLHCNDTRRDWLGFLDASFA